MTEALSAAIQEALDAWRIYEKRKTGPARERLRAAMESLDKARR